MICDLVTTHEDVTLKEYMIRDLVTTRGRYFERSSSKGKTHLDIQNQCYKQMRILIKMLAIKSKQYTQSGQISNVLYDERVPQKLKA